MDLGVGVKVKMKGAFWFYLLKKGLLPCTSFAITVQLNNNRTSLCISVVVNVLVLPFEVIGINPMLV